MSANNQSINVSVVSGWGTNDFDLSLGVVDAGGLVARVECSACLNCGRPFKVGEAVALVTRVASPKAVSVYHMDCLPQGYRFLNVLSFANPQKM